MTNEQLKDFMVNNFADAVVEVKQFVTVAIAPEKAFDLLKKIKETQELAFDYLINITGVDYGKSFGLVYHLTSSVHNHTLVVKTQTTDKDNLTFDSVYQIWNTADFHEREIFDLLGYKFNNHPDLRRIFLDENWDGHPLRKDYVDEINIVER